MSKLLKMAAGALFAGGATLAIAQTSPQTRASRSWWANAKASRPEGQLASRKFLAVLVVPVAVVIAVISAITGT
jgi:hypothetical protein